MLGLKTVLNVISWLWLLWFLLQAALAAQSSIVHELKETPPAPIVQVIFNLIYVHLCLYDLLLFLSFSFLFFSLSSCFFWYQLEAWVNLTPKNRKPKLQKRKKNLNFIRWTTKTNFPTKKSDSAPDWKRLGQHWEVTHSCPTNPCNPFTEIHTTLKPRPLIQSHGLLPIKQVTTFHFGEFYHVI